MENIGEIVAIAVLGKSMQKIEKDGGGGKYQLKSKRDERKKKTKGKLITERE